MKKYYLLAVSAALVLSACSNEIVETATSDAQGEKEFAFQTYLPVMTRAHYEAAEAESEDLKANGFYLGAYSVDPKNAATTVYFASKMAYADGVWGFSSDEQNQINSRTWPKDPSTPIAFYGVYTANPQSRVFNPRTELSQSVPSGDVWNVDTISGTEDLMATYKYTTLAENPSGIVTLDFKHILAKVEINFIGGVSGYNYTVGAVKLKAARAGSYAFATDTFTLGEVVADTIYKLDEVHGISSGSFIDSNSYPVSSDLLTTLSTNESTTVGTLIVAPALCQLDFGYIASLPNGDQTVKELQNVLEFTPQAGKRNIVNVTINPETKSFQFNVNVLEWQNSSETIELNNEPQV